jgi:integrase
MAKRMRGLYKRGDVWWCCYKGLSGKVVRESTNYRDYDEAVDHLSEQKYKVKKGEETEIKKIINYSFKELCEHYDKWSQRQKGYEKKKRFIEQLEKRFGDILLNNLHTQLIEEYQSERLAKGNKPATVNRVLAVLRHSITKAVEWEMCKDNILKKVRNAKLLPVNNARVRYLTREELKRLIVCCNADLAPMVILAVNTGMRKGELLNLKWQDVDLVNGFLHILESKNNTRRTLPLNDTAIEAVKSLPRRIDGGYVFFNKRTGSPIKDVKRSFGTALRNAGILDFRFHDLRHCAGSYLAMSGVDLRTIQEILGHKTLAMTLRYSHLSPLHTKKAVSLLDITLHEDEEENSSSQLLHS